MSSIWTWCGRSASLVILVAILFAVGCSGSDADDAVVFGAKDSACESVRLSNDDDDQTKATSTTDCLLAEIDAGRAVTVDIAGITAEGDPIYMRYAFDGASTLIIEDGRADTYGAGRVDAQRCDAVQRSAWFPEGVDCEAVDHPGFPEALG